MTRRMLALLFTFTAGAIVGHVAIPSTHSQKWLEHWDRQIYLYMTDQVQGEPVLFPLDALRAVMKYTDDPASWLARFPISRTEL